jgi:hypothetical protein
MLVDLCHEPYYCRLSKLELDFMSSIILEVVNSEVFKVVEATLDVT